MDVGGVSEIVSAETGLLLHPDDSPQQIAKAISELLSLPKEQKERLRKNVLNNWRTITMQKRITLILSGKFKIPEYNYAT